MRISTNMMQRLAVNAMLERQADLSITQQQLATGRRILTPSQDPSGSTQILRYEQELELNRQFQRNTDRALSRLEMEESVLAGVGDALQRVRELAVQGLNDTNSADNRAALAMEVRQRLDEILKLANTKDGNGEYLFSGFRGKTEPFEDAGGGNYIYRGDRGQRYIQISPTRQVPSSDSGFDVFVDIPAAGGGRQDIFKTVYDLAVALEADNPSGDSLTNIDNALDNLFETRAAIGSRINTIESQRDINEQFIVQLEGELSAVQDLDYAEAIGRLNLQLAGLQASQASFERVQNLSLFNYMN